MPDHAPADVREDLPTRLQAVARLNCLLSYEREAVDGAASEISRLRAEVERLTATLTEIAFIPRGFPGGQATLNRVIGQARRALSLEPEGSPMSQPEAQEVERLRAALGKIAKPGCFGAPYDECADDDPEPCGACLARRALTPTPEDRNGR